MTFGAHKVVCSERFWTTYMNFDNYCQRCYSDLQKILYRCTSMFSALNYCGGIFQISQPSLRCAVGHKTFSANLWTFRNF